MASLLTGGAGNNNYWHWLFDVLPRIKIINNVIDVNNIDFFLLPNSKIRFQEESLNLMNIPKKKRLSSIIYIHLDFVQIISTEHPYVINNDASNEIQNLPNWIIEWLRETFINNLDLKDKSYPKKIYIDRSDASPNIQKFRQIINETEVEKETLKEGYKSIILGNLSFQDQIKYFYNAEKIIGLHGAGFANLVFVSLRLKCLSLSHLMLDM